MKIGDKIVCIYNSGREDELIEGKQYKIVELTTMKNKNYIILNGEKSLIIAYSNRFMPVKFVRKQKLENLKQVS